MYNYLYSSLILAIPWLLVFFWRKDLRKQLVFTSLLLMPLGLTEPLFVPDYWTPTVLHTFGPGFDIESLLHVFVYAGLASVLYEALFGFKTVKIKRYRSVSLAFIYGVLSLLVGYTLILYFFTDISPLRGSYVLLLAFTGITLAWRKDLVHESIVSGLIFMVIHVLFLGFLEYLYPGFLAQWNPKGIVGTLFTIPIDEYFYGLSFGLYASILYETVRGFKTVRLRHSRS